VPGRDAAGERHGRRETRQERDIAGKRPGRKETRQERRGRREISHEGDSDTREATLGKT
jgi:hypothetical protein